MPLAAHWEGAPCSCVCPAIPLSAAVPGLLCTLTYSCPTGWSETDTHELQRSAWTLPLFSRRFDSQAAASADGLWRLNHSAHGCYCQLLFVKFKGHLWGQSWIDVMSTTFHILSEWVKVSANDGLSACQGILTNRPHWEGRRESEGRLRA